MPDPRPAGQLTESLNLLPGAGFAESVRTKKGRKGAFLFSGGAASHVRTMLSCTEKPTFTEQYRRQQ
jgi:hypothetical protein